MNSLLSDIWSFVPGGITFPHGFEASGVQAGLKSSGRLDLALIYAPKGAVCSGTFTNSSVRASCIDLAKERLEKRSGRIRAILINSGQANACTGDCGLVDSLQGTKSLSELLGLEEEEVLICSTGVIGETIPMQNLLRGLEPLVENLSQKGGNTAANAILTTDLREKEVGFQCVLGNRTVRIGGMAKGSGMIHPNMATMLAYLTCDVGVEPNVWSSIIRRVADASFNAISVDGDTSTNDAFLAFSAGKPLADKYLDQLEAGLLKAAQYLAKSIVRDVEGANCLIEVLVEGA